MSPEEKFKRLELLLSGLSTLHDDGFLPQVYSVAIESVSSAEHLKLLAEVIHQRWLSDPSFPPIAAKLCFQLADLQMGDIQFSSMVFGILMNDFKDRFNLRKTSRVLFANSVYFIFEFYFLFRNHGPLFSALVTPLFQCLQTISDKEASETELQLLHKLFCLYGKTLESLNPRQTEEVLVNVRATIHSNQQLHSRVRGRLLELLDLSYYKWSYEDLPYSLQAFYHLIHYFPNKKEKHRKLATVERTFSMPARTSQPPRHFRESGVDGEVIQMAESDV